MAKPKKRRKKKRKSGSSSASSGGGGGGSRKGPSGSSNSGGGVMQGIRSGFQRAAGVSDEADEGPSTLSNVLWGIALLAAVGFLLYRWYG